MPLQSLSYQTDMIFYQHDSQIMPLDDYLVIKTPQNPTYHFGNLILFFEPPTTNSHIDWPQRFEAHFVDQPETKHQTFVWKIDGMADPAKADIIGNFQSHGYEYEISAVLAMQNLITPCRTNQEIDIRFLVSDTHWQEQIDLKMADPYQGDPVGYRPFVERRVADWRSMTQRGNGVWFGAYKQSTLVASCGLFWSDALVRFQSVDTHPDHRRQQICTTLIHHVCQYALQHQPGKPIVIEAEEDYHAIDIYRSLGFVQQERTASFSKS